MKLSISDFVFYSLDNNNDNNFSSKDDIDYFFSTLPDAAIENWPLNLEDKGFITEYISAKISNNSWKEDDFLVVQAKISNNKYSAILEQEFRYGAYDNLIIKVNSLHKPKKNNSPREMRIARIITQKNLNFLRHYDEKIKPLHPSKIVIFASSEMTKQKIHTCGGYVWANNGFEFEDKTELAGIRRAFRHFVSRYGIKISDSTLKLFTKPCHFAAYHNGKYVEVNGQQYHIGKAFLLQQSWNGVQKASSQHNVEQKYADAYHNEPLPALRHKKALQTLSKKYQSFIEQSHKKNVLQKIANKFKSIQRLTRLKLFEARHK